MSKLEVLRAPISSRNTPRDAAFGLRKRNVWVGNFPLGNTGRSFWNSQRFSMDMDILTHVDGSNTKIRFVIYRAVLEIVVPLSKCNPSPLCNLASLGKLWSFLGNWKTFSSGDAAWWRIFKGSKTRASKGMLPGSQAMPTSSDIGGSCGDSAPTMLFKRVQNLLCYPALPQAAVLRSVSGGLEPTSTLARYFTNGYLPCTHFLWNLAWPQTVASDFFILIISSVVFNFPLNFALLNYMNADRFHQNKT